MNDLFVTEIEPLVNDLSNKSTDDLVSFLSEQFIDIRHAVNKKHFGHDTDGLMRAKAVKLAACCVALVGSMDDAVKED